MNAELAAAGAAPRSRMGDAAALALLTAVMLAGPHLASLAAARGGLPVSRGMIFEGEWLADSWRRFPWADCAAMLLFMTCLPIAWDAVRGRGWRAMGLRVGRRGFAAIAAGLVVAIAACAWRLHAGRVGDLSAARIGILLLYFAVVAVAEEAAFRGVIQRRARDLVGRAGALALAAAAFAAWHGFDAPAAIVALRAAAGLVFGLLYLYTGGLAAPVAWHWALNLAVAI